MHRTGARGLDTDDVGLPELSLPRTVLLTRTAAEGQLR